MKLPDWIKESVVSLHIYIGLVLVGFGVWLVDPRAALVVVGAALVYFGAFWKG